MVEPISVARSALGLLPALFDFLEGVDHAVVQVNVLDAGQPENRHHQVAQLLGVGFVGLGGDVGFFAAVLS